MNVASVRYASGEQSAVVITLVDGVRVYHELAQIEGDIAAALASFLAAGGAISSGVDLVAYAKDASWRKEVGGITVAGVPVATDEKSQLKVLGARVAADANPNWSTVWDGADGNSYPINAAAMIAISDAVQAHVNQCFVLRAEARAGVTSGEITTTADIDQLFA